MPRTRKQRNGRRRKTLKMRGGNFDDPDTKDFMNSKIADLEQKIAELENNMPVQIGYKALSAGTGFIGENTYMPFFVNKNINVDDFWMYVGKGDHQRPHPYVHIFLPALHSLPNVRGLKIEDCVYSFRTGNIAENQELRSLNVDALNAKYPGLFVSQPPLNPFANY